MSGPGSSSGSETEWRPNGRPMSTVALNFSAALDDLFKLGALDELAETVEARNRSIESQKSKLEDLEAQLQQADEALRRLEIKHKRMSRRFTPRQPVAGVFTNTLSSSDSDEAGASSPRSDEGQHHHEQHPQQQ